MNLFEFEHIKLRSLEPVLTTIKIYGRMEYTRYICRYACIDIYVSGRSFMLIGAFCM